VQHDAVQSVLMMPAFSILATPCAQDLGTTRVEEDGRREEGEADEHEYADWARVALYL